MGWLVGSILASLVTAFIVVKVFDYIVGGATSGLLSIARAGLFVVTWTAVTSQAGMNGFSKRIRNLRKVIAARAES
jgi:hypothetical protein